jgi:hypothetical protein
MRHMNMNRLVLIRIEEKYESEIFKNLWHYIEAFCFRCKITTFF